MKLGLGSYTYTWAVGVAGFPVERPMSAFDLLEKAADLGVDVAQYADNLPLTALTGAELDRLISAAGHLGIALEIGARGIGRENVLRHLELAGRIKAPFVRFVVDSPGDEPSPGEVIDRMAPLMPAFRDAGVIFAMENHDRFAAAQLSKIVEALGPGAGICLDTVNSLGCLEGPDYVVETLARYAVNLHVKDFEITRTASQMGFEVRGCAAGRGRLDIAGLLKRCEFAEGKASAIIELWTPFAGSLEATMVREDDWANQSVAYMRQFLPILEENKEKGCKIESCLK